MTLANIKQMVDAELEGRVRRNTWRKTPSQVTTAGHWFDLSMSPGNPPPKYWFDAPPLIAKQISQSADGGIFHGANTTPMTQYLRLMTALTTTVTALPLPIYLLDYLLYYPSCDDSTTDPQTMDNSVTLPRYTDGKGVQILAVSVAGRTGGQRFFVTYTNSDGVAGRTSQTVTQNAASAIGTIQCGSLSTAATSTPFIGLQHGDSGVRSIESVTMVGPDVGLFTLILVKPLAQTQIKEITAPYEKDFFLGTGAVPEIKDDAYLNMICIPNGSLAATALIGDLKIIWN
jgi:hypothetical protein